MKPEELPKAAVSGVFYSQLAYWSSLAGAAIECHLHSAAEASGAS